MHPDNSETTDYLLVESTNALEQTLSGQEAVKRIAVDLEADSLFHFRERVCLIQMAGMSRTILVDPLKMEDISRLGPIFYRKDIRKIFHGADYDIRSLFRDFGFEIRNLFDTELASRFLGMRETGLEAVLLQELGVQLDKRFQKKNWSQRPLPVEMLEYAARDVHFLIPLAEILEKALSKKGRLSWVREECEHLSKVRSSAEDDDPLFLRFKGAGQLDRKSLCVLEAVLQARKKIAEKKDVPVFKVFGNASVLLIARNRPESLKALKNLDALWGKQLSRYGELLVETVKKAMAAGPGDLPQYPRRWPPSVEAGVAERLNVLKKWRLTRAAELQIDPGMLCNKSLLFAIARRLPREEKELEDIAELKKWQRKELGAEVVSVLKEVR